MAKRQNFVVGSTNPNTETLTQAQLNNGWDKYQVLKSGVLDGTFNAVSDYSNDSSNEIANAIASITGSQPTGQSQSELAGALNQMRQDIETSSLTFKGYVSDTAPSSSTYSLIKGDIWIDSATLPTTFPVAIAGVWDGTQWESTTDTYTVKNFDFFRNINDNEGYYWFGGEWVVMSTDMSTTYFTLNQTSGKWEIKSSVNLPGSPTTTSPAAGDNSTKIPTTEWVQTEISSGVIPAVMPVGAITAYAAATAPAGWLLCDGSAVSRTTYAALFAVIGTAYGPGDGSTTFNLPNYSSAKLLNTDLIVQTSPTENVSGGHDAMKFKWTDGQTPGGKYLLASSGGNAYTIGGTVADPGNYLYPSNLVAIIGSLPNANYIIKY